MCIKYYKSLQILLVAALLIFGITQTPWAQSVSNNFTYTNAFEGPLRNNTTTTLFEVNVSGEAGGDLLGCSGIDLFSFSDISFNMSNIMDNFAQHLKSVVAKNLMSSLLQSPQIMSIFSDIQALGSMRFDMFNESCDVGEIKKAAKQMFVDRCVAKAGGKDDAKVLCQTQYDKESRGIIKKLSDKYQKKLTETGGNITETLRPAICGTEGCALMTLLPQMRVCTVLNFTEVCEGVNTTQTGEAPFSSSRLAQVMRTAGFEIGAFIGSGVGQLKKIFTDKELEYALYVQASTTQTSEEVNAELAAPWVNPDNIGSATGAFGAGIIPRDKPTNKTDTTWINPDTGMVGTNNQLTPENTSENVKNDDVSEFKKFLHCSNDADPLTGYKSYLATLKREYPDRMKGNNVGQTASNSKMAKLIEEAQSFKNTTVDEFIDWEKNKYSEIIATANAANNMDKTKRLAAQDLPQLDKLLKTATTCIFNHYIHINVDTFLQLSKLKPADQIAYIKSSSQRMAYLGTEMLLRFMKQKILQGYVTMATTPLIGAEEVPKDTTSKEVPKDTTSEEEGFPVPQEFLDGVKAMADMVENRIKALQAVRKERDTFAEITERIDKILKEIGERGLLHQK